MITAALLLVPLIVSGVLTIAMFFLDADLKWKFACALAVLACVALRFVVPFDVPFLVPFLVESVVAIGLSVWLKTQYS